MRSFISIFIFLLALSGEITCFSPVSVSSTPLESGGVLDAETINGYTIWLTTACVFKWTNGGNINTQTISTGTCNNGLIGVNPVLGIAFIAAENGASNPIVVYTFNSKTGTLGASWSYPSSNPLRPRYIVPVSSNSFWIWSRDGLQAGLYAIGSNTKIATPTSPPVGNNFPTFGCSTGGGMNLVGSPDSSGNTNVWNVNLSGATKITTPTGSFSSCISFNNGTQDLISMTISTVGFGLTFAAVGNSLVFNDYLIMPEVGQIVNSGISTGDGDLKTTPHARFWLTFSSDLSFNVYRDNFERPMTSIYRGTTGANSVGSITFQPSTNKIRFLVLTSSKQLTSFELQIPTCTTNNLCNNCISKSTSTGDPFFCRWNELTSGCENSYSASSTSYFDSSLCPKMSDLDPIVGPAAGNQRVKFAFYTSLAIPNQNLPFESNGFRCLWNLPGGGGTSTSVTTSNGVSVELYGDSGKQIYAVNASCLTPSSPDGDAMMSVTYKNLPYASNSQRFGFGGCNLANTSYQCFDNYQNSGFTNCGWCNSLAGCTRSTLCASGWDQLNLPNVTGVSSTEFAMGGTYPGTKMFGNNFYSSNSWRYTVVLNPRPDRFAFPNSLQDWTNGYTFPATFDSSNSINFTLAVPAEPSIFSLAVYQSGSLMVQNMSSPLYPRGFSIVSLNCSSYDSCDSCPKQACSFCRGKCVTAVGNPTGPCISSSAGNCSDVEPTISFEGENCNIREGKHLLSCDAAVTLWYAPPNVNFSVSFEGINSSRVPLEKVNATKRDAASSGSTNKYVAKSPFSTTLASGSYTPEVYIGDSLTPFVQGEAFDVFNCADRSGDCNGCSSASGVCSWCDNTCLTNGETCGGNTVCPSTSTSSSDSNASNALRGDTNASSRSIWPIIVGVAVGVILLLVIIAIVVIIIVRKRPRGVKRARIPKLPPPPNFETVAYNKDASVSAYNISKDTENRLRRMEDILFAPGFQVAVALQQIPESSEIENFSKYLLYMALSRNKDMAAQLLSTFITQEIETTKQETTLFRLNCISTAMFSAYAKAVGLEFLWKSLAAPIWELQWQNGENTITTNLELDPEKVSEGEREFLDANSYQILMILSKIFESIQRAKSHVSPYLRKILTEMRNQVGSRFPESERKAIGMFLFLRYIVPAIVSPQNYSLLEEPPSIQTYRMLVLVSKVMQNLANETLPSTKAPYMEKLDQFVADNIPKLHQMYDDITNFRAEPNERRATQLPGRCHENAQVYIHDFLVSHRHELTDPIFQDLLQCISRDEISNR